MTDFTRWVNRFREREKNKRDEVADVDDYLSFIRPLSDFSIRCTEKVIYSTVQSERDRPTCGHE
jgi:hypothetical protein